MNNLIFACITMLFSATVQAQSPAPCVKIGYADMSYIFSKMPAAKQIEAELKSLETQLKNQLEIKRTELQKKSDDFKKYGPTMIATVRQNTLRELELLNNNLVKFQGEAEATLQQKHAQLMEPLYKDLGKAIEEVAKEDGLAYILNPGTADADMILYADEKYNVSDLVLKKLLAGTAPKPLPE
jgi:outer membrane protein